MAGIEARFQRHWPGFVLDVDVHLPERGVTAFFGHSGSGKTTLLRCIAGLERAPGGRLVVRGQTWQDARHWVPTHQRPLGYVFQEASLFPHLNVLNNLRYGLRRSPGAQAQRLEQAIELLGIQSLLARSPQRLSGGERQRVSIARALAVNPQILLMDEPLAALDVARKQEILPYLERLHAELDLPMLYVTHAPDEVARLADHLVVLENGRVAASGPLTDTLAQLNLPITLGEDAGVVLHATVGHIDPEWHLARVDFDGGSLWVMNPGVIVGQAVRVRVLARDVSVAEQPGISSIQNLLRGTVDALQDEAHPGAVRVRLRIGPTPLWARLTRRAAHALVLRPGKEVWVQVKSAALL